MGCGVSRPVLTESEAPPPAGLTPLRRRIEEIKRNRRTHKRSPSRLSSKQLLRDGDIEHDTLIDNDSQEDSTGRKSVSSPPLESITVVENNNLAPKSETLAPQLETMVTQSQTTAPQPEIMEPQSENLATKSDNLAPKSEIKEEEQKEDEEDYENRLSLDGYGSDLGPGSPSFREYCNLSSEQSTDFSSDEIEAVKDNNGEEKTVAKRREERRDSVGSSDGSVTTELVKKEHKKRRFKRVLPRGGQAAVKNFLTVNVRSCYTPPCSNMSNHHHHHHQNKPTTAPA